MHSPGCFLMLDCLWESGFPLQLGDTSVRGSPWEQGCLWQQDCPEQLGFPSELGYLWQIPVEVPLALQALQV
jgi:hypothetical protein